MARRRGTEGIGTGRGTAGTATGRWTEGAVMPRGRDTGRLPRRERVTTVSWSWSLKFFRRARRVFGSAARRVFGSAARNFSRRAREVFGSAARNFSRRAREVFGSAARNFSRRAREVFGSAARGVFRSAARGISGPHRNDQCSWGWSVDRYSQRWTGAVMAAADCQGEAQHDAQDGHPWTYLHRLAHVHAALSYIEPRSTRVVIECGHLIWPRVGSLSA
jgi:hypothetical protein